MSEPTVTTMLIAVNGSQTEPREDQLVVEEPLEIQLNWFNGASIQRESIAITMRTPGDDRELACGFLVGEGIIHQQADIQSCEFSGSDAVRGLPTNVIKVTLAAHCRVDLDRLQRHFYTTSSCGICGKASIEALEIVGAHPVTEDTFTVSHGTIHKLIERISEAQLLFRQTGGIHAAAAFDQAGNIVTVREDVGRHNALDKVIGERLLEGQFPIADRGLFVSGRASFELLQKAVMAGVPLITAVGAPSSLAVDVAREYNISLLGFMRDGRFNLYAGEHRLRDLSTMDQDQ